MHTDEEQKRVNYVDTVNTYSSMCLFNKRMSEKSLLENPI